MELLKLSFYQAARRAAHLTDFLALKGITLFAFIFKVTAYRAYHSERSNNFPNPVETFTSP